MAELLERGGDAAQGRRVLGARGAGRSGRRDISERIEEILASEVTRRHFTIVKANRALALLP
jgi:hypothetical protein